LFNTLTTLVALRGCASGAAMPDRPAAARSTTADGQPASASPSSAVARVESSDSAGDDSQPVPPDAQPPAVTSPLRLLSGVTVLAGGTVEIEATVCRPDAWLEQVACAPGTREHESLLVVHARPQHVHAALLAAGYIPGEPGRWVYEGDSVRVLPPRGPELAVLVRYRDAAGAVVEHPVREWIAESRGSMPFPDGPWVFGGSRFVPNTPSMGPGEHYVADMSGSVIGLVTFGDEVIGFSHIWADEEAAREPEWVVSEAKYPPQGTAVTIILRPFHEERLSTPQRAEHR
jgi:hypothetical protein